jgi:YD repeat-containing protein
MVYDVASNLLNLFYSDGAIVTQQYDPLNRMTTAIDWAGSTTFAYSPRSEMIGKTDPGLLSQAYRYDGVFNRIGLTDPDGGAFTYSFDARNAQIGLVDRYGGIYTSTFDANNRVQSMQSAIGRTETSEYDSVGRVTTLIQIVGSPVTTVVASYDPAGRKLSEFSAGSLATYLYDPKSRLIGQNESSQNVTMQYDAVDNVLVKWYQGNPPLTMSYDRASRLTTSTYAAAVTAVSYDGAGNMTAQNQSGVITGYYYDPENRLTKVQQPDGSLSTYTYQGYNGLRRSNQESAKPIYTTIWDDRANYLGEIQ